MTEKFGLAELERYESEVGFKKNDVRIIKGVCAIVDLPVTVVSEVTAIIKDVNKNVIAAQGKIVSIETEEGRATRVLTEDIARMRQQRVAEKDASKLKIAEWKAVATEFNGEVSRLEKLLKNFS